MQRAVRKPAVSQLRVGGRDASGVDLDAHGQHGCRLSKVPFQTPVTASETEPESDDAD